MSKVFIYEEDCVNRFGHTIKVNTGVVTITCVYRSTRFEWGVYRGFKRGTIGHTSPDHPITGYVIERDDGSLSFMILLLY